MAIALATLGLGAGACGGQAISDPSGPPPDVVASTGIAADIVAAVAGGDLEVGQLVPEGAVPHSYSPSAAERADLEQAGLFVYFSPALEEGLPLDGAQAGFALSDHVGPARGDGGDPHVWMDPTLIAAALPDLAAALESLDPENATRFDRRARSYADDLRALDRGFAEVTAAVPASDRKLVTSHDLLGYFAARYGFEVIGAPFGFSPEAEASAAKLAELIDAVEAEQVPAVFAQRGDDADVLRTLADEAGVEVVDDLLVESLSAEASTYPAMMRFTAARISDALGG